MSDRLASALVPRRDPRPGVRVIRCSRCTNIVAKLLPDNTLEIVRRRVVIAVIKCGYAGCPTCGGRVAIGPCATVPPP